MERISRSDAWRAAFIKRNSFRCHYCNRRGAADIGPDDRPWHVDHMKPLARGGDDAEENLALACKRCNAAKGVQNYELFRQFASRAFWVPSDWRTSEAVLDSLMRDYAEWGEKRDQDREWKIDLRSNAICFFNVDGELDSLLQLGENYQDKAHLDVLGLVLDMYEELPALIAEIRMFRAAEAEASVA